jgi:hypothetical protein
MATFEGLYSITFGTAEGAIGDGIAVFANGKVRGGDSVYFYTGTVRSSSGEAIEADIHVQKYGTVGESVFGNLREFRLILTGNATTSQFVLSGHMVESPGGRITVRYPTSCFPIRAPIRFPVHALDQE